MPRMAALTPSASAGRYKNGIKPYSTPSTMARRLLVNSASTLKLPSSCTMPEPAISSLKALITETGMSGKSRPAM